MLDHQRHFLERAVAVEALCFGRFTLKSGRISPYFFNAARFDHGSALLDLGRAYAAAIAASGVRFDGLFGPAYKGIPLATATALALSRDHGRNLPLSFDRKEAKAHGEGGRLIGAPLKGRILIVDDVITAGTAIRAAVELIREQGATPSAVILALDRQERGNDGRAATRAVAEDLSLEVISIATLNDLLAFSAERGELSDHYPHLLEYRAQYGCERNSAAGP